MSRPSTPQNVFQFIAAVFIAFIGVIWFAALLLIRFLLTYSIPLLVIFIIYHFIHKYW